MAKTIPVAIYWLPPSELILLPRQADSPPLRSGSQFALEWREVKEPEYRDYQRPVARPPRIAGHTSSISVDASSAEEFIQKHLTTLRNIEFKKLPETQHWPVNCGSSAELPCFSYTHIVHVHPFLDLEDFVPLWIDGIGLAFQTALYGIVSAGRASIFYDSYQTYFNLCVRSDPRAGELLGELVTTSNPNTNVVTPLFPFFASSFLLSFIIYTSAFIFKFLTVLRQGSIRFLKTRGFYLSERIPFTQAAVVAVLVYLVTILVGTIGSP